MCIRDSRYTVSGRFAEQKEKRYANKRSAREADKLPLGCLLYTSTGQIAAVSTGLGAELLFIQALPIVQGLLGRKSKQLSLIHI